MAQTPEGKVKTFIDRILKSYGAAIWWFKPATGGFGKSGVMDYVCCVNGYTLTVEAKATEKQTVTALQEIELRNCRTAGGIAIVINADNMHSLRPIIEDLLAAPPARAAHQYGA